MVRSMWVRDMFAVHKILLRVPCFWAFYTLSWVFRVLSFHFFLFGNFVCNFITVDKPPKALLSWRRWADAKLSRGVVWAAIIRENWGWAARAEHESSMQYNTKHIYSWKLEKKINTKQHNAPGWNKMCEKSNEHGIFTFWTNFPPEEFSTWF